jgi:HAD superfamily hydrolase (TIGR01450 family)
VEAGEPLWASYDLALLDLDGVVYIGGVAVPGAPEHLERAVAAGMSLAYVTNNASRPPSVVADHLRSLGVPVTEGDVVTSAQAAARLLADRVAARSPVFVIGGAGLYAALEEVGLQPTDDPERDPAAVVSGYHPDVRWGTVMQGAILVRRGLLWVASNTDMTVPTAHGPGPGNGVLVAAVAGYAGRQPLVAGKPESPLFEETVRRIGGRRPLVVGDRLDTDIEGATRCGLDSLLVMTGVTGLDELVAAPPPRRPSYVASDLAGLGTAHPLPSAASGASRLGGWVAAVDGGRLEVSGDGVRDDWWRVVADASWAHLDATGAPVDTSTVRVPR